MENCVFCKIAKKESPATIVFENSEVIAFKSIEPVAEVHILICPKTHIESVMDITNFEIMEKITESAQKLIEENNIKNGYKLVFNGGKYQFVPHLHWHLLGGKFKHDSTNY